jgi:gluconolactonase
MTANRKRHTAICRPFGRRALIKSLAASGLLAGLAFHRPFARMLIRPAYAGKPLPDGVTVLASGLQFPEGPVALSGGSVLVCESAGGRLTRVDPKGEKVLVADVGGGPTGAAFGPDGALYVCNPGAGKWETVNGLLYPVGPAPDNSGGCIQRVDITSGAIKVLYTEVEDYPLGSPNDIVFDSAGGFWFTDTGKSHKHCRQYGAVCYARADGSLIRQAAAPMISPNGIGLSPDGKRLYVSDLMEGALLSFDVVGEGQLAPTQGPMPGDLVARLDGRLFVDGLAVQNDGTICVATPINGGISCWSPDGRLLNKVDLPHTLSTNICFGGPGLKTAYITLGGTGELIAMDWTGPGLPTAWHEDSRI